MGKIRVLCEVSDKYIWTLKPFSYLFNKHWSPQQEVTVVGYSKPEFVLPDNFSFYQISKQGYPAERWSDGIIQFLKSMDEELFVLLLCDYWLCRGVDTGIFPVLEEYMDYRKNIVRFDLSADRLYAGGMRDFEYMGKYDIIKTDNEVQYQMSLQAAVWRKSLFLEIVKPGMSAWQIELYTLPLETMLVVGTRQWPVRYANGILKGHVDFSQIDLLTKEDRDEIMKYIPDKWTAEVPKA